MECPYLEVNEFGEAICHCIFDNDSDCPTEYIGGCPVEAESDCQGDCSQCNNKFNCDASDYKY